MKVGVISGGGDAPGTNAVIRAVVRRGLQHYGDKIIGIVLSIWKVINHQT